MSERRRKPGRSRVIRWVVQGGFLGFVLARSVAHNFLPEGALGSVDSICPFGGVETLWQIMTAGTYVPKLHPSNLVLGAGLVVSVLLAGGAFCGWVCPFGTVQDALFRLGRKLRVPVVRLPRRWDAVLRWGRYVMLAGVLAATAETAKLWFADYDPYRTLFGMGWLFEPSWESWPAYAVVLGVAALSVVIERPWCKYLCPLGGAIGLLQRFSVLKIRREAQACTACHLCNRRCPMGLDVEQQAAMGDGCIACLECVESCPSRAGALQVALAAPVVLERGVRNAWQYDAK